MNDCFCRQPNVAVHGKELEYPCTVQAGIDRHVVERITNELSSAVPLLVRIARRSNACLCRWGARCYNTAGCLPAKHPPRGWQDSAMKLDDGMTVTVTDAADNQARNPQTRSARQVYSFQCWNDVAPDAPRHSINQQPGSATHRPRAPRWRERIRLSVTAWAKSCCRPHGYSGSCAVLPNRGRPKSMSRSTCGGHRTRACCCT